MNVLDEKVIFEQAIAKMTHDTDKPKKVHLFLTKKQYESDPDWWHDVLRKRGLSDDTIIIVPSVFNTKGYSKNG